MQRLTKDQPVIVYPDFNRRDMVYPITPDCVIGFTIKTRFRDELFKKHFYVDQGNIRSWYSMFEYLDEYSGKNKLVFYSIHTKSVWVRPVNWYFLRNNIDSRLTADQFYDVVDDLNEPLTLSLEERKAFTLSYYSEHYGISAWLDEDESMEQFEKLLTKLYNLKI